MNRTIHNIFVCMYINRVLTLYCNSLLAEFRFFPELIIYGVYLLEVALKKASPHTIHTTIIFQTFRKLTITCVQLANVPL